MANKFKILNLPTRLALIIRARSSVQNLPNILGEAYGAIMAHLNELGETPSGPPFVIYYNLDMQDLDISIGFPVSKKLPEKNNMKMSQIDSGNYATTLHIGPYDEVESDYNALNQWIKENGYETLGPAIEFYLNDPREVGPENTQTEIQLPLK